MQNLNIETIGVRTQLQRSHFNEHSAPLYLTSSFVFDSAEDLRAAFNEETEAFIYSRYGNPNNEEFVSKVSIMEGAEAGIATSSGMAAIYATFMSLVSSGDHVISCSSIFGATHTIFTKYFPKIGVTYSYFDANDVHEIEKLIKPNTKFVYLETPTNPAIEVIDLELVNTIVKKHGLILIVDNCFATPYLQKPIGYGADIVIHSATKYMDGQGRVLGGVVVGKESLIREIYLFNRITGASLSPFNAWILSKSMETLPLRMDRHCDNALKVARFLEGQKGILQVKYPFLESHPNYAIAKKQMKLGGGIVAFTLEGGLQKGAQFLNKLNMIKISANLGDSRTIATHPASSTHCKLSAQERLQVGIDDGMIRISVGLEHYEDIINDLSQAL